ncbi:MAG: 3-deoxy-D-manno-octulosonic acid transferase, partial [Proteobacteria bacterium]|nr:3-deoxy-D-manno-octulosonic acid transferase [Pseudomonadota bacterium]
MSPIILGHILWLSISNKQSRYFWQRLGFSYSTLPTNSLWFHCASVGEVNTLLPLIKNIHKKNRALNIIITTNTVTGAKIVNQQNLSYLFHSYLPFDWVYSVNRFLSSTKPAAIYIMETEIWPNLFTICNNKNIAINIINARLSKKTTSAKPWIKKLIKNSLLKVNNIYARSEENADAFQQLGAAKNTIQTIGNLKLSTAIPPEKTLSEPEINRKYILVASTHNDEELQIYN